MSEVNFLRSTGERVEVLYTPKHVFKNLGSRSDTVEEGSSLILNDATYVRVMLPPQSPGHAPRFETMNRKKLRTVRGTEASIEE